MSICTSVTREQLYWANCKEKPDAVSRKVYERCEIKVFSSEEWAKKQAVLRSASQPIQRLAKEQRGRNDAREVRGKLAGSWAPGLCTRSPRAPLAPGAMGRLRVLAALPRGQWVQGLRQGHHRRCGRRLRRLRGAVWLSAARRRPRDGGARGARLHHRRDRAMYREGALRLWCARARSSRTLRVLTASALLAGERGVGKAERGKMVMFGSRNCGDRPPAGAKQNMPAAYNPNERQSDPVPRPASAPRQRASAHSPTPPRLHRNSTSCCEPTSTASRLSSGK